MTARAIAEAAAPPVATGAPAREPAPLAAEGSPGQVWPWALLTIAGLIYLIWAGSSYDPRKMPLWFFKRDGWISLAPGLGHLAAAWAISLGGLSMVAWRARAGAGREEMKIPALWQAVTVGFIAVMALDLRLAVMRTWMPLVLDPVVLAARSYHPAVTGRGLAILADMATLAVLLVGLSAQGRNLWLAALFALHPLAIMESAANGSRVSWFLPLVALLALGWRLHKWLRELLIMSAAAGCTWWLAHVALAGMGVPGGRPFDGWLAEILATLGLEGRPAALTLVAVEALLQGLMVWCAFRGGWSLARTLGHMAAAWAVVSPTVMPAAVLPLVVLGALAWTRAGWVLSGTVVAVYLMMGLYVRGGPWVMPSWLVFLMVVPVAVVEGEELVMELGREKLGAWGAGRA